MTIPSANTRMDYDGNGSASSFAFTYYIIASSDIMVFVRRESDDHEFTLALTTDYTVPATGVGVSGGGSVNLTGPGEWLDGSGHLKTGYHLTILRVRPITQLSDFRNMGPQFPETYEDTFDQCRMIDAQQEEEIARSLKLTRTQAAAGFDPTLPYPLDANDLMQVNGAGNGFVPVSVAGLIAQAILIEGLGSARPATPATSMLYFATDDEQMFYYSIGKGKWYAAF